MTITVKFLKKTHCDWLLNFQKNSLKTVSWNVEQSNFSAPQKLLPSIRFTMERLLFDQFFPDHAINCYLTITKAFLRTWLSELKCRTHRFVSIFEPRNCHSKFGAIEDISTCDHFRIKALRPFRIAISMIIKRCIPIEFKYVGSFSEFFDRDSCLWSKSKIEQQKSMRLLWSLE